MATKAKNLALAAASKVDASGNIEADTLDTLDSLDFYAYDNSSNPILSSVTLNDAIDELSDLATGNRQSFTATSGQTVFTTNYKVGALDVYLNGLKLLENADYTATSGTSFTLSEAAQSGDIVDIVSYGAFSIANHYTKAEVLNHDQITVDAAGVIQGLSATTASFSGITNLNNKTSITHTGTMSGGVNLSNYYLKIGDGSSDMYFDGNEIFTNSSNLHIGAINADGKIAFSAGSDPENYRIVTFNNGVHVASTAFTPGLTTPSASAALEVGGTDGVFAGGYNYAYTRDRTGGIGVYGAESSIEIAGNDNGNHSGSLHLRNGDEGFSLINDPENDQLSFRSFTATGNNFYIHAGGNNATVTTAMNINKTGEVNFPSNPAWKVKTSYTAAADMGSTAAALIYGNATYLPIAAGDVRIDRTGDFNIANGSFTAPVSGIYMVGAEFEVGTEDASAEAMNVGFFINGTIDDGFKAEMEAAGLAFPYFNSRQTLLELTAGQYVQFGLVPTSNPTFGFSRISFWGYLVG